MARQVIDRGPACALALGIVFCNQCGHLNADDANFCSSCGALLEPERADDTTITFLPVEARR